MFSSHAKIMDSSVAVVVGHVRRKGVKIWSQDGQLRYRAPRGVLTPEEIARMSASRREIIALLESEQRPTSRPGPRQEFARAPLTFSQQNHWQLHRLGERTGVRQLAAAIRLRGRLQFDVLEDCYAELVRRHEALRTRIVTMDGAPVQLISETGPTTLDTHDLQGVSPAAQESEIAALIAGLIMQPIELHSDPLFAVQLARLHADDHVLMVAMEHTISDAFSLDVLLRDLFTLYVHATQGCEHRLPPIPVQLADYASWQRQEHPSWLLKHGAYWAERLAGAERLRFPEGRTGGVPDRVGWGTVPLVIDSQLKAELNEWCRQRHTTAVMAVFTVYVAAVMRWCDVSDAVLRYQTDGRTPEVENAIGYFAAALHLRVRLTADATFLDLLDTVTQEYCNAHEHADDSYIDAQLPPPPFTHNGRFNWVPHGAANSLLQLEQVGISASRLPFEHPLLKTYEKDSEPVVLLYESATEISGGVHYPLSRFSDALMQRFGSNFSHFLRVLLQQPGIRVSQLPLV
jgi:hypothetical protein